MIISLTIILIFIATSIVSMIVNGRPIAYIILNFRGFILANKVLLIITLLIFIVLNILKRINLLGTLNKTFGIYFDDNKIKYLSFDKKKEGGLNIREEVKRIINRNLTINNLLNLLIEILLTQRVFNIIFNFGTWWDDKGIICLIVSMIFIILLKFAFKRGDKLIYENNKIFKICLISLIITIVLWVSRHTSVLKGYLTISHYALFLLIWVKLCFVFIFQIRFITKNDEDLLIKVETIFNSLKNSDWVYDNIKQKSKGNATDHSVNLYWHRKKFDILQGKCLIIDYLKQINIVTNEFHKYYFYPTFVVVKELFTTKTFFYKDLGINYEEGIEKSYWEPNDAKIIDEQWDHANKDGSQDKRFSFNLSFKSFKIGKIVLTSGNRVIFSLSMSNIKSYNDIEKTLNELNKQYYTRDIVSEICD